MAWQPFLLQLEPAWLWAMLASFGAMTFLFPMLAALLLAPFKILRVLGPAKNSPLQNLEVLIPAYNEEDTIEETLESIHAACSEFLKTNEKAALRITIAIDGALDKTPELVAQFANTYIRSAVQIHVIDRKENKGKWKTLEELISHSKAQWSAIVDAGTVWPVAFLVELAQSMQKSQAIGFAPGYKQQRASIVEKAVWLLERTLKKIENLAGGPVSVHGATMVFQTKALQRSFQTLNHKAWLNDDVVLALQMRTEGEIHYFGNSLCVFDAGVRANTTEIHRRKRMVRGNLEWIAELFPVIALKKPFIAMLSLRRVFRVLWIYLLLISSYCFARFLGLPALSSLAFPLLAATVFCLQRRLRDAALASVLSPYLVLSLKNHKHSRWL